MEKNLLFSKYLNLYDKAYYGSDKEYEKEIDQIVPFLSSDAKTILDVGSGTGKHAAVLLKRGFRVHSIDISDAAVKRTARNVRKYKNGTVEKADVTKFRTSKKFDVAIALFVVLSYVEQKQLLQAFKNIYTTLKPGGIFVFDVVNGVALGTQFHKDLMVRGGGVRIVWRREMIKKKKCLETTATIYTGNKIFNDRQTFYYYELRSIRALLRQAGLKNVDIFSDYLGHKDYKKPKTRLCVVCRK